MEIKEVKKITITVEGDDIDVLKGMPKTISSEAKKIGFTRLNIKQKEMDLLESIVNKL